MKKLLRTLAIAAVGLFAVGAPAFAANTFVPAFEPYKHVLLDPRMADRTPLSTDFERALDEAGRQKGLDVYLVVVERGDDLVGVSAKDRAAVYIDNILLPAWKYDASYKAGNIESTVEIIAYIRDPGSDAGSIAVHAGGSLMAAGINARVLSADNGPVLPNSRQWVRTDPQRAFLEIQGAINAAIDNQPATFLGLTAGAWILIIIIVVVILLLCCCVRGGGGGGFFVSSSCSSCSSGDSGSTGGGDT
jgi:hypothetical protein